MSIGRMVFLQEEARLPKLLQKLPLSLREKYLLHWHPYTITKEEAYLLGVLQCPWGSGLSDVWRTKAEALLREMKASGCAIVVAPWDGEIPRQILPVSFGNVLLSLLAFEGAREALRRKGKNAEAAKFVLVGGSTQHISFVLGGIGTFVNQLSFFHDSPSDLEEVQERLFIEHGLLSEVFSSVKNPLLSEADVVIDCGSESPAYAFTMKKNGVWITVNGNRPGLRRLLANRPDVLAMEALFVKNKDGVEMDTRQMEAILYCENRDFRDLWHGDISLAEDVSAMIKDAGILPSGFIALGKRQKIAKK